MCGALAMSPPRASKSAQEKSSRSLMLTECAVARSRAPICSATDINRLLKISSMTGSTAVPAVPRPGRGATRSSSRSWPGVTLARQPASTTVVAKTSAISAGPSTPSPGRRSRRRASGTSAHRRFSYIKTLLPRSPAVPAPGGVPREPSAEATRDGARRLAAQAPSAPPGGPGPSRSGVSPESGVLSRAGTATSTDTASTRIALPGMRNENCCRYARSNSAVISATVPSGTGSAVSVPS